MSNRGTRILTAVVLLGVVVTLFVGDWPRWLYLSLACVIGALCLWEADMMRSGSVTDRSVTWLIYGLVAWWCVWVWGVVLVHWMMWLNGLMCVVMAVLMWQARPNTRLSAYALPCLLGTSVFSSIVAHVACAEHNPLLWLCLVATAWVGDSLAYFGGSPHPWGYWVSPTKSIRGFSIGACAMLAWLSGVAVFFDKWSGSYMIWMCVMVVLIICGDLWMSLLKRLSSVKDSGHILPGHGGILDRLDSQVWIAGWLGLLMLGIY